MTIDVLIIIFSVLLGAMAAVTGGLIMVKNIRNSQAIIKNEIDELDRNIDFLIDEIKLELIQTEPGRQLLKIHDENHTELTTSTDEIADKFTIEKTSQFTDTLQKILIMQSSHLQGAQIYGVPGLREKESMSKGVYEALLPEFLGVAVTSMMLTKYTVPKLKSFSNIETFYISQVGENESSKVNENIYQDRNLEGLVQELFGRTVKVQG